MIQIKYIKYYLSSKWNVRDICNLIDINFKNIKNFNDIKKLWVNFNDKIL